MNEPGTRKNKTYHKGVTWTKQAMQTIEDRIERLPRLAKWFVDIHPAPA